MSRMVIMISLFGRVRFTHLSDLAKKVETGNWHRINAHTIVWWTVKWVMVSFIKVVCNDGFVWCFLNV